MDMCKSHSSVQRGRLIWCENYRPISIICSITKIFEKLIFNQLSLYISSLNILSPFQSGFRPNFSTTTALLKFTNDVFSSFDKGQATGANFIALSKAFNMVNHYLLLDKLSSIGFTRNALLWFNAYLHNRHQYVVYKGFQSDYTIVEKGLLFSIFINDLSNICLNCSVHLYADDTVIYTTNSDLLWIQNSLQSDFNLVQKWFHNNMLMLNKNKSCCMLFGTHRRRSSSFDLNITFDYGLSLEAVDSFKYLGLWIDIENTFKPHIDFIVNRTYGCLHLLYRSIICFTCQVRNMMWRAS